MTRTQEIAERLAKADAHEWTAVAYDDVEDGYYIRENNPVFGLCNAADYLERGQAEFVAAAPTDISYLLARVAKLTEALSSLLECGALRGEIAMTKSAKLSVELARAALSETDT